MEEKKKLKREDIKITTMNLHFEAKIPSQAYGSLAFGGHWGVEIAEDQDPMEVSAEVYDMIRESVSEEIKPIAKKVYEMQVTSLVEDLPAKKRDEIMARFALVSAVGIIDPHIASFLANDKDVAKPENK